MSAKCAQQSMILTYQIFCVLNLWSLQGSHYSLLPSISKHLEKFTILTDQIIHTLKVSLCTSVCNNTVVMWPLFIEVIVSFCIKKTQGKFMWENREFHFGYNVATLFVVPGPEGGLLWGVGREWEYPSVQCGRPPCGQNSWHTLLKILPCPKLHCWLQ